MRLLSASRKQRISRWIPLPPRGYRDRRVRDRPARKCSSPIRPHVAARLIVWFSDHRSDLPSMAETFACMLPDFRMKYAALGSTLASAPRSITFMIQLRTTGAVSGRPMRLVSANNETLGPPENRTRHRYFRRPDPPADHEEPPTKAITGTRMRLKTSPINFQAPAARPWGSCRSCSCTDRASISLPWARSSRNQL